MSEDKRSTVSRKTITLGDPALRANRTVYEGQTILTPQPLILHVSAHKTLYSNANHLL